MKPIVKKIILNASVEKVWKAISEPSQIEKWMMMKTTFQPEAGTPFTFTADPTEGWDGIFKCKVKEVVKNKRLVYTWDTGFINAETLVEIDLKENGNQTELTLTHSGWEKMAENQEQTKNSHDEGWDLRFVQKLKEILQA